MVQAPARRRAASRNRLTRIHLAHALIERAGTVLLVASRYPNHPDPLWNLPGGRQEPGELLTQTLVREVREETGLVAAPGALLYLSESYDGATHFLSAVFAADAGGDVVLPEADAHAVDVRWVEKRHLSEMLAVRVVREPLLAHLAGEGRRYFGYAEAGIAIEFAD